MVTLRALAGSAGNTRLAAFKAKASLKSDALSSLPEPSTTSS
jgi:hypothetical protein